MRKLPPPRTSGQRQRILALLRERGSRGVLSSELYEFPWKFGRCPGSRICELRKQGYAIEGEPRGKWDHRYWLVEMHEPDPGGPVPPKLGGSPAAEDVDDLPLFVGLRSER